MADRREATGCANGERCKVNQRDLNKQAGSKATREQRPVSGPDTPDSRLYWQRTSALTFVRQYEMGRKSRRELERELNDIDDGETNPSGDRALVQEDPDTGEWYDDAELTKGPLDKDSTDPLMVLQKTVVETGYDE